MKSFFTIILFLFTVQFFGQPQAKNYNISKFEVTGTIIDKETKQPLEYATIIFTPLKGGKITGGITNAKGNFKIDVTKGIYTISIEFISFKTKTFENQIIDSDTNLGIIALEINTESLDEVEIIAEKSTVEIRLD